jgi:large subunit ribosomal protein L22
MTQVTAQLNGLRIAPRKVRALVNLVRGKDVVAAIDQLNHFSRRAGAPLRKLLESAVANAENNFKMSKDGLFIKSMTVDEGIKLKRFMPKGFGRAGAIQKKTSRVNVILAVRGEDAPVRAEAEVVAPEAAVVEKKAPRARKTTKKTE